MNKNNYCVILAGGVGARLWPCSHEKRPKQFIDIIGSGRSMLQETYDRFCHFIEPSNIIVVTNSKYIGQVKEQLPDLSEDNILLEPMRRNTVPSVIWSALNIQLRNPVANIVISPIDQIIRDKEAFEHDILHGLDYVATHPRLLTLGVVPSHPETTYGYIQMESEQAPDIYKVKSFTEKPQAEFARIFFENKEFLWNTGLFIWNVKTILSTIVTEIPEYAEFVALFRKELTKGGGDQELINTTFASGPNDPIETGILEKTSNVDVMQCHFGWADIGTWESLYSVMPKDENNNVTMNTRTKLYNCHECIVKMPEGRIVVLQDLENYVVAEEGNVLVVCKKDDQEGIRRFVNEVEIELGEEYI